MVAVKTRDVQLTKVAPLAPVKAPLMGAWCTVRIGKREFEDWLEVTPILGKPVTPLMRLAVQTAWGDEAQLVEWSKPEPDDSNEAMPQRNCKDFAEP
jgi:hypothetical protein